MKRPIYTSDQQAAIRATRLNLVVTAGAGSGKTTVLVERFIAMLERHPEWALTSIVAITFTEKAAREMRDRVRQRLEELAREQMEDSRDWGALAVEMDSARIGTIHALCTSILRANAAEAGLDPGFSVIEDLESALLVQESITDVLSKSAEAARLLQYYELKDVRATLQTLVQTLIGSDHDLTPFAELDSNDQARVHDWQATISQVRLALRQAKGVGTLDFNDLERMTRQLLHDHAGVRARYQGAEFRYVMVDEYQDTNPAQHAIVRDLAGDQPERLFVVGDPKQGIYRFRGAEVGLFATTRDQITANGTGEQRTLHDTFRAHSGLAAAFNHIFSVLFTDSAIPYAPMIAQRQAATNDPALTLTVIPGDYNDKANNADGLRAREAAIIARQINADIIGKLQVWDKATGAYRAANYSDIVLIGRKLTATRPLEEAFKQAGIPYIVLAGRGYFDRPEVLDLLNLLGATYDHSDDLALATALRSPLFALSDEDLLRLRLGAESDHNSNHASSDTRPPAGWLWTAITASTLPDRITPATLFARDCLIQLGKLIGRVTTAELLTEAITLTGYTAVLIGLPNGAQLVANIDQLIEKARVSTLGAGDFIRAVTASRAADVREGEAAITDSDMVRIMTVHASKGLEFPVVMLWDINAERKTGSTDKKGGQNLVHAHAQGGFVSKPVNWDTLGDSERESSSYTQTKKFSTELDDQEAIRLLYVAMTRAQDYLFLSAGVVVKKDKNSKKGVADYVPRLNSGSWLSTLQPIMPFTITRPDSQVISHDGWTHRLNVIEARPAETADTLAENTAQPARSGWQALAQLENALQPVDTSHLVAARFAAWQDGYQQQIAAQQQQHQYQQHQSTDPDSDVAQASVLTVVIPTASNQLALQRRIVGTVIHRLLRTAPPHQWGDLNHDANRDRLRGLLGQFAWAEGLINPVQCEDATDAAYKLLPKFQEHALFREIGNAEQTYYEIPVSHYSTQNSTHNDTKYYQSRSATLETGIIDALYKRRDQWHIVDYKTAAYYRHDPEYAGLSLHDALRHHATRYHDKMRQYALGVQEITGQWPRVHIFYVRYGFDLVLEIKPPA